MEPLTQKVLEGTLKRHPFGNDDGRSAASYLGAMTYRLVQKVLPHVTDGMKWLQDVAGLLADNNQGVLYTTALGFPMLHKPVKYDTKRVKVLLLDRDVSIREQREIEAINTEGSVLRRFRLNLADEPTGKVVKYEARNGIAPNVIHAADSTHLMMCVNAFGGKDIITIHDSFGVHPCDVQELRNVLLNEIVSLYDTHCPFTVIDAYARKVLPPEQHKLIPKIPKKGSLNLRAIRRSPYAFN